MRRFFLFFSVFGFIQIAFSQAADPSFIREADIIWAKDITRAIRIPKTTSNEKWLRELLKLVADQRISASGQGEYYDSISHTTLTARVLMYHEFIDESTDVSTADSSQTVLNFWIFENWFFDKQRSVMDVRIKAIAPLINDEFRGVSYPLFWTDLNGVRNELKLNHSLLQSFDKVFLKRNFEGQIIKERTLDNNFISDYASGEDTIHESDRIQNEINRFDKKFWKY
jgi:hypothetical protein